MKYGKVYHDGRGSFIFETGPKGPAGLMHGVLLDAASTGVGEEYPVASFAGWMPNSDFREFTGTVPPAIARIVAAAPDPSGS